MLCCSRRYEQYQKRESESEICSEGWANSSCQTFEWICERDEFLIIRKFLRLQRGL